MSHSSHDWAVLLAGGHGTRLRGWAGPDDGGHIPKPFRRLVGDDALFDAAARRARRLAAMCRIVSVVAAEHEPWWGSRRAAGGHWLVQPHDRGTGVAVLSATLFLLMRDPDALLVVLPADHAVADDAGFIASVRQARRAAALTTDAIVLVGSADTAVDDGYGWIVPAAGSGSGTARVDRFVGRPEPGEVDALRIDGALVDTFIVAATARGLLGEFRRVVPDVVDRYLAGLLDTGPTAVAVARAAAELPHLDFGRSFLEPAAVGGRLMMTRMTPCGWADLGTPERVAAFRNRPPAVTSDAATR